MGTNGQVYTQADYETNEFWHSFSYQTIARFLSFFKIITIYQNNLKKKRVILAISMNYEKAILPDELAYSDLGDSFEE